MRAFSAGLAVKHSETTSAASIGIGASVVGLSFPTAANGWPALAITPLQQSSTRFSSTGGRSLASWQQQVVRTRPSVAQRWKTIPVTIEVTRNIRANRPIVCRLIRSNPSYHMGARSQIYQ